MADLRLDFCTHEAAKHAVLRWHYSRAMPSAKLVRIGVWEGGQPLFSPPKTWAATATAAP